MKIYIAGPFFSKQERDSLIDMIKEVQDQFPSADLFIPMNHEIPNAFQLPNEIWAKKVFEMDVEAINDVDMVVAMYTGHYSDTGTVWEMGYAYSKGIPVIGYIPEWAEPYDMSLMVINCFSGLLDVNSHSIKTLCSDICKYMNQK